jgi:predicted nuclease of predicted toxin-antitoxin system
LHVKLLLDENLSPAVAVALSREGVDAAHVRDRGLTGATDPEVLTRAYDEDRILVTANVADFDALARATDLHAGIAFVEDGDLMRGEQSELLRRVVAAIEAEYDGGRDMVNRVVRVSRSTGPTFEGLP